MKDTKSPAPSSRPAIYFVPTTAAGLTALMIGGLTYGLLKVRHFDTAPFSIAAAVGAAAFGVLRFGARSRGVRVDDVGLSRESPPMRLGWGEIESIHVGLRTTETKAGARANGVVSVSGNGQVVEFPIAPHPANPEVTNVQAPDAPLLLALIAHETDSEGLFPESWRHDASAALPGGAESAIGPESRGDRLDGAEAGVAGGAASAARAGGVFGEFKRAWGLVALLLKLGPKLFATLAKVFKTIKPVSAVVTVGVYSVVFSWKFAIVLVLLIGIHECGHIFAAVRCGVPIKGIYFIPFFGGAAVTSGHAKTRRDEAYIAANGPVWGALSVFLALALWKVTGEQHPILAAAAAWGALINLFNLLPILPLDGGRLLNQLAYSWGRGIGSVLVVGSLLFGAFLGSVYGYELIVFMVFIGTLEYMHHLRSLTLADVRCRLPANRPLDFEEFRHFRWFVSPRGDAASNNKAAQAAYGAFESRHQSASLSPMTPGQSAFVLAIYLGLAGILFAAMRITEAATGIGDPMEFLR